VRAFKLEPASNQNATCRESVPSVPNTLPLILGISTTTTKRCHTVVSAIFCTPIPRTSEEGLPTAPKV